ncbi:MAG TPA: hypothetical protein VFQ45_19770 [Longimicrobium sp.]|nr:hypothetical protein [Longimicrobium sp.]
MKKLTLDLESLDVESFETGGQSTREMIITRDSQCTICYSCGIVCH